MKTKVSAAPFLPSSRREMDFLGWKECDIILINGDAYVDHPAFGTALIGRYLEGLGYRIGIISQPDLSRPEALLELGKPRLWVGVTSGAMDSMVNHYTALGRKRTHDDYSEGGKAGLRPDRAILKYVNALKAVKIGVPIVIGGIEAGLRRVSHYDFWSNQIRKSILLDCKADILVYGMGETAVKEISHRIVAKEDLTGIRGTAVYLGQQNFNNATYNDAVWLPSHEEVATQPKKLLELTRIVENEANPYNAKTLLQAADSRLLIIFPPAPPLASEELDALYRLPFARRPHPRYKQEIPAFNMIKDSLTVVRGCGGGCSFCALALHQGKIVQSRSQASVLEEAELLTRNPNFTGIISDVGGPSANLYGLGCRRAAAQKSCRKVSCLYPEICNNFNPNHREYIELLNALRRTPGIRRVFISSGIRFDLALKDETFLSGLAKYHVSGHLKVAPEHEAATVLKNMRKPSAEIYRRFKEKFAYWTKAAGKEQYLTPYLMAGFPGCQEEDMKALELSLRREGIRPQQVQVFLPIPMTMATAMYYTGLHPEHENPIYVARTVAEKKAQLQCLQYYKPETARETNRREQKNLGLKKKERTTKVGARQSKGRGRSRV